MSENPHGFAVGEFLDFYDTLCSIQKSSLADEDCIWLGVNEPNAKILTGDGTGWHDYPLPPNVTCTTRMHLNREQVAALLPILPRFVETGEVEAVAFSEEEAPLQWYELINPSDPIEFSAESDEVAALAALVLGVGSYSARRLINGQAVGPQVIGFAFFGGDGGYQTIYGRSLNEGMSALRAELTSAFASFRIKGGGERSSLSDICAVAHRNAKVITRGGVAP
jgi:hypothetical protein